MTKVVVDWLERRREEIVEPDLPIVDPHHHLVDRPELLALFAGTASRFYRLG